MLTKCEYENKLASLGCREIGSGLYSNVFSVPNRTDIVIKVADLDPWPSYIKWATENGHAGKLAPKVYSLKFHSAGFGYYVAIMERLVCTINEMKFGVDGRRGNPVQVKDYEALAGDWRNEQSDCEAVDLVAYYQLLKLNRFSGDIHDRNVMVRHDGQIVVTDPVSGAFNSQTFRIKNGVCP